MVASISKASPGGKVVCKFSPEVRLAVGAQARLSYIGWSGRPYGSLIRASLYTDTTASKKAAELSRGETVKVLEGDLRNATRPRYAFALTASDANMRGPFNRQSKGARLC
jgi:hypothetical protein